MSIFRWHSDNKNGTANILPTETTQEFADGYTRVQCADGRVFDVGVRDTVWSPDLERYVEVFYPGEAQEVYPDWDWRKA